jgi:hypothetical protein
MRLVRGVGNCWGRRDANLDGSLELKEDGLGDEDLASLGAEVVDLFTGQLHSLSRTAATDF